MALHCTECGFVNIEGANYCQRCGAPLARAEDSGGLGGEPTTATYRVEMGDVIAHGPALVIRAGGGRVGESFALTDRGSASERMSIGRRPEAEVFLDDVTVSRDHALLIRRGEQWHLDDCGSLNGTYVNRSRIESQRLEEGDEVQIG
jgi:hypothetical protein